MAGEDNTDNTLPVTENFSYEKLLRKFIKTEEELRVSNLKLKLSEEEVRMLKRQTVHLRNHVEFCGNKIAKMAEELEVAREQLTVSNDEIARLKMDPVYKDELPVQLAHIEAFTKEVDRFTHKYDMLKAEKDEADLKILNLMAEVRSKDNMIENMKKELSHSYPQPDTIVHPVNDSIRRRLLIRWKV